jgi:drug/metabolite transporter (DMT)-like permease
VLRPFLLLLVAIGFTVCGEFLLKAGMNQLGELDLALDTIMPSLVRVFTTPIIVAGFGLIFAGSIFWLAVISRIPLSIAHPMLSLSYVATIAGAWMFLGESVTLQRIVGVAVICTGVVIVSRS